MKKIYFLFVTLSVLSCKQPEVKQVTDSRPKNEILLINKFKTADSIYRRQRNDIRRSEVSDSAQNSISDYVIKDLNLKADKWVAKIYEMRMSEFPKSVDVKFMIALKNDPDKKYPETEAIVLLANVDYKSKKIVDNLKGLTVGDNVILSCKFDKVADGTVNFNLYSTLPEDDLTNPRFAIELTAISKK